MYQLLRDNNPLYLHLPSNCSWLSKTLFTELHSVKSATLRKASAPTTLASVCVGAEPLTKLAGKMGVLGRAVTTAATHLLEKARKRTGKI